MDELMQELTDMLLDFKYPKNTTRKNIMNEGDTSYYGFVLGKVRSWAHKDRDIHPGIHIRDSGRTNFKKYIPLYNLAREVAADYEFTTIQFNKNYQCNKHIDKNNVGISQIIGFGEYEGGELLVYYDGPDAPPTAVDIKNKFHEFNGAKYYHETAPFTGERHTLVFYNV